MGEDDNDMMPRSCKTEPEGASVMHLEVAPPSDPATEQCIRAEPSWTKYVPGGFSESRCIQLSGRPMLFAILVLASACITFFGYDAAVMSLVNINPDYLHHMNSDHGTNNDAARVGGLVSVWFLGFLLGAAMAGSYADSLGRLRALQIGCVWGIVGAALLAAAQNFAWMTCARIISGVGCGHLNTIAPIWTSELADYNMRGAFVAVQFCLCIAGAAMTYWIEYACLKTQSLSFAWRFPLGFQLIFLLFILIAASYCPETPRHLAQIGRFREARDILSRCRLRATQDTIDRELAEIRDAIRIEATQSSHGFLSMIWKKDGLRTRRRVALAMGIQCMQKLTGPDVVAAFGPQIFALSGYTHDWPAILAGLNFLPYVLAVAVASYTIERFGRRKLLLGGLTAMGILLIITGILAKQVYSLADTDDSRSKQFGGGVVALVFLYTVAFGSSWIVCSWVYPTEIFPLATRAKGVALSTISFSVAGGVINEIIPYIIKAAGFWVFIIFGLLNLVQLIPVWCFYIETANRPLEDLDILFASDSVLAFRAERTFSERQRALGLEDINRNAVKTTL